jgi:hypothetical protein
MKIETIESGDPKAHARNIGEMLGDLVHHVREDAERVKEPKAQALFETSAEVLLGLQTAFEHYATGAEKALS